MDKRNVKWFTERGYSWEHPGFIDRDLHGLSFTVGHSHPDDGKLFTVQIMDDEGQHVTGRDCKTREQVHAYYDELNYLIIVGRMKDEVVRDKRIPTSVRSFSDLHDYIDANELGGFCDDAIFDGLVAHFGGRDAHEGMPQGMMAFVDAAQNEVHAWIEAGGLKARRSA